MGDLPTGDQAEIIRKLLGLRKVAPLTDGQRATLHRFSFARDKTQVSEQIIDVPEGGRYPPAAPLPEPQNEPLTAAKGIWRGRSYCRTKEALLRACAKHAGEINPTAAAILVALPDWIEPPNLPSRSPTTRRSRGTN
jgi:hypothetical protein